MLDKRPRGSYYFQRNTASITKFLNRLLGLPVHTQNSLFQYFCDTELVKQSKMDGTYDLGILDLGVGSDRVQKTETRQFRELEKMCHHKYYSGKCPNELRGVF